MPTTNTRTPGTTRRPPHDHLTLTEEGRSYAASPHRFAVPRRRGGVGALVHRLHLAGPHRHARSDRPPAPHCAIRHTIAGEDAGQLLRRAGEGRGGGHLVSREARRG